MAFNSSEKQSGRGRPAILAAALLLAVSICAGAIHTGPAGAVTPQEKYDRAQAKLSDISGSVDELKGQIAADNQRVDALLGELSGLRARADQLEAELAEKQAALDALQARLDKEKAHLKELRARLQRALDVLRDQIVALYMSGTPDVEAMVLASADWSDIVTQTDYADAIQDHDEAVINRVSDLRDEVRSTVERMEGQEVKLEKARDQIAVEEKEAAAARDALESQRADYLASIDSRQARITALQNQASDIEGNLPDLSVDPASSSAPSAPAPTSGETAALGSDGLAVAPAGAPEAVKGVIAAANSIVGTPYLWGGGHGSFESSGYDCSGAVSFALNGGGLISSPLDSTGLTTWGEPGVGNWITVYGNSGHAFAVIAGLRWDTSGTGGSGPKWSTDAGYQDESAFVARHPSGL